MSLFAWGRPWFLWGSPPRRVFIGLRGKARLAVAGAAVASRESDRMSLSPQWCLGVLFWCFCLASARARPGAFGTDLKAARQARTGDDGLGRRGDTTHPSHVDFVARILVSYRTLSNILVALSRCSPRTRRGTRSWPLRPHVSLAQRYAAFCRETLPAAEALRSASYAALYSRARK